MVNANLMYGFPEETKDDLHESLGLMTTMRYLGCKCAYQYAEL